MFQSGASSGFDSRSKAVNAHGLMVIPQRRTCGSFWVNSNGRIVMGCKKAMAPKRPRWRQFWRIS